VLDIGCAGGFLGEALRARGCRITGVDVVAPADPASFDEFRLCDLNAGPFPADLREFDCVLLLDVVEHLQSPERFVDALAAAAALNPNLTVIVSTGNVAFAVVRLMLLVGQFNYGKRGILDLTHTRLFTFATFRRLFEQAGFSVSAMQGVPAPFPLALGNRALGRLLLRLNAALLHVSRSLFAFQIFAVIRPRPSLAYLLDRARSASAERAVR
jgi:2-polyprenyl-3-methyl-5-hydroxy-6-metoxy-1,4-benzoquinol methylase